MNATEHYHGWLIELSREGTGYSFRCWLPEEQVFISDRKTYPTMEQALRVAKIRADLEAVYLVLLHFLNEVYQQCNLSPDEHIALASSVLEFVLTSSKKSP
ncbi:MAG TPA: hypothetical protein V6C95_07695 [Coleofasciculaceae cyanobacterium]